MMREIKDFIELHVIKMIFEDKHIDQVQHIRMAEKFPARGSHYNDKEDFQVIQDILKRFKLINPALLYSTIKKC